jgi:hypothetical protein
VENLQITNDILKLTIEIIANLVHIKNQMYDLILKPAGIKNSTFVEYLSFKKVDGKQLTKRELAAVLLDEMDKEEKVIAIKSIIKTAAYWDKFHLADNEYNARATVQKARETINIIEIMEEKELQVLEEVKNNERLKIEMLKRQAREKLESDIYERSKLLLMMYDDITLMNGNPQKRGYMLEELINMLFQIYEIALLKSFRRNDGGEQIDGAFKLDGWHYIVEMKWTSQLTDIRQLDTLYGKVGRSGKQTLGLFISINGWSTNVIPLVKQNPDKSLLLMDGYDLRVVLTNEISLIELLQQKLAKLNLESEPFSSVRSFVFND